MRQHDLRSAEDHIATAMIDLRRARLAGIEDPKLSAVLIHLETILPELQDLIVRVEPVGAS